MRCAILEDTVLGRRLRAEDQRDLAATTTEGGEAILIRNIVGKRAVAFDFRGQCQAVGGVVDVGPAAVVWLLGSAGFDRMLAQPGAARLTRRWLDIMAGERPCLFNIVPESNTRTLRWLGWLGFVCGERHHNFRGLGHDCVTMTLIR